MQSSRLTRQCEKLSVPLFEVPARPVEAKDLWFESSRQAMRPELLVLARVREEDEVGSWCEGGTLNLLMKAAAFPMLARYNTFKDPVDARRRYLEAQCEVLRRRKRALVQAVLEAETTVVLRAAEEIPADAFIAEWYPRVTLQVMEALWRALGADRLSQLFSRFMEAPYDYRSGWPDLVLVRGVNLRFIEVKTTDLLHKSQLRIIENFLKPFNLDFSVAQVTSAVSETDG